MSLSRKHYQAIADIIKANSKTGPETFAARLSDYFAEDNPNFDRERFMDACGFPAIPEHDYRVTINDFSTDSNGNPTAHYIARDAKTGEIVARTNKRRQQCGYTLHRAEHAIWALKAHYVHHTGSREEGEVVTYLRKA